MTDKEAEIVTLSSAEHSLNALKPIAITLFGIIAFCKS